MNKPILQLIIFLLIIAFCTLILFRFIPSSYLTTTDAGSVNSQLSGSLAHLAYERKIYHNYITSRKLHISLYYLLEIVKSDLANGKYEKAENTLKNLLLFYPRNKTVLSLLGGVLYSSGDYEQAKNVFELILQNDSGDPFAREKLGMVLEKQHNYSRAISEFMQASLLNPGSASMYLNLAGLYSITGDKARAIHNFVKAYQIIGDKILPLTFDPAFDNIRDMPAFIRIIKKINKGK